MEADSSNKCCRDPDELNGRTFPIRFIFAVAVAVAEAVVIEFYAVANSLALFMFFFWQG